MIMDQIKLGDKVRACVTIMPDASGQDVVRLTYEPDGTLFDLIAVEVFTWTPEPPSTNLWDQRVVWLHPNTSARWVTPSRNFVSNRCHYVGHCNVEVKTTYTISEVTEVVL